MTEEDREKLRNFLAQYVELLRKEGNADDQYKADVVEDLMGRI